MLFRSASAIDTVILEVVMFTIPSVVVNDPVVDTDRYPIDNDPIARFSRDPAVSVTCKTPAAVLLIHGVVDAIKLVFEKAAPLPSIICWYEAATDEFNPHI